MKYLHTVGYSLYVIVQKFLKYVCYAYQGCIYLIKNTVNNVKNYYNKSILIQFKM